MNTLEASLMEGELPPDQFNHFKVLCQHDGLLRKQIRAICNLVLEENKRSAFQQIFVLLHRSRPLFSVEEWESLSSFVDAQRHDNRELRALGLYEEDKKWERLRSRKIRELLVEKVLSQFSDEDVIEFCLGFQEHFRLNDAQLELFYVFINQNPDYKALILAWIYSQDTSQWGEIGGTEIMDRFYQYLCVEQPFLFSLKVVSQHYLPILKNVSVLGRAKPKVKRSGKGKLSKNHWEVLKERLVLEADIDTRSVGQALLVLDQLTSDEEYLRVDGVFSLKRVAQLLPVNLFVELVGIANELFEWLECYNDEVASWTAIWVDLGLHLRYPEDQTVQMMRQGFELSDFYSGYQQSILNVFLALSLNLHATDSVKYTYRWLQEVAKLSLQMIESLQFEDPLINSEWKQILTSFSDRVNSIVEQLGEAQTKLEKPKRSFHPEVF